MSNVKLFLLAAALWALTAVPSFAGASNLFPMSASPTLPNANQYFYCPVVTGATSGTEYKCTAAQIAAYGYSLMSGSCTATSAGVVTCTSAGVSSFSYSCPVTGPLTGAVTVPLGIGEIPKTSAFAPTPAQCGAWFDVTGTTTASLPVLGSSAGQVQSPYFITIKNNDTSGHVVTIQTTDGSTINYNGAAATSLTINAGQSVGLVVNAANTAWSATGTVTGTGTSAPAPGSGYTASTWFIPFFEPIAGGAAVAVQATANTYCTPGEIGNIAPTGGGSMTISALGMRMSATGSTTYQLGLYANDYSPAVAGAYRPGLLIASTNQIANTSAANTTAAFASNVSGIVPGLYWFCLQANDGTMTYFPWIATELTNNLVGGTLVDATTTASTGVTITGGTYGTWPANLHGATFVEINAAAARAPIIAFDVFSIP